MYLISASPTSFVSLVNELLIKFSTTYAFALDKSITGDSFVSVVENVPFNTSDFLEPDTAARPASFVLPKIFFSPSRNSFSTPKSISVNAVLIVPDVFVSLAAQFALVLA